MKTQKAKDQVELKHADSSPWATKKRRLTSKEDPHAEDMAGTSLAVGRFFDDKDVGSPKTDVAVGAPKANRLMGRVYLCKDCFWSWSKSGTENMDWKRPKDQKSAVIEGTIKGSRFGHSVCSVNLDDSGVDEVVVGAPLFSRKKVCSFNPSHM